MIHSGLDQLGRSFVEVGPFGTATTRTVQIDHRRDEAGVAEQFADRQQVHAGFQQSRRVRMPQHVRIDPPPDSRFLGRRFHGLAKRRVGQWFGRVAGRLRRGFAWEQQVGRLVLEPVDPQLGQESR